MTPAAQPLAATPVEIAIESDLWAAAPGAEAIVRRALAAAADVVRALPAASGEVSVVLADDAALRALNSQWRQIDKPTNVLSFPATAPRASNGMPRLLGDIAVAYETTAREAAAEHKPVIHHLAHLAVHGFLHLVGYDHESDEAGDEMERLEAKILARLDIPNPYGARPRPDDAA
jgi:probable rRNA maturation factor